jgi:hypothetical protein
MDGNTEGRRLLEEAAAFSVWRRLSVGVTRRYLVTVSLSILRTISWKAWLSSVPLAAW